jgi:hypothetical protein
MSLSGRALWLLLALVLVGNCSSHDVSLGDDLPPPPEPILDPDPPSPPSPTPVVPAPCELADRDTFCLLASEHCSGRIITRAGFECPAGEICCEQTVGTGAPMGGSSGVEPPAAGAGGQ